MDKGLRPIPALYACYLLRSTVRHASLYVGSTPDPVRRLKQHNGVSKGGAVRTSKDSLRPWEITCLVTGFPSKIAALQFEWAWQNTHLTRHIDAETRITQAVRKIRISPKTGRVRKRTARPRLSLTDRIANLHLLLQACSFERWPLRVTFYVQDVYKMWRRWVAKNSDPLAPHIEVLLDDSTLTRVDDADLVSKDNVRSTGIEALQVDYQACKSHLEKSKRLFSDGHVALCAVCQEAIPSNGSGALTCPEDDCSMVTHISCLSTSFLATQQTSTALVPTVGQCPSCSKSLNWLDLVRELTLRMRGEAEVAKLFKPPRTRKKKGVSGEEPVEDEDDDDAAEDLDQDDVWHNLSQSSVDIDELVTPEKPVVQHRSSRRAFKVAADEQPTIEDSEWDDAEVLT